MWIVLSLLPLDPVKGPTPAQILLIALGTSPSVIGLLLAGYTGGRGALRGLWARLAPGRAPLIWYLPALLTVPTLNLLAIQAYRAAGGAAYPLPTTPLLFAIPAGNFLLQPPAASTAEAYLRFHLSLAVVQWSLVGAVVLFAGKGFLVRSSRSPGAA